MTKRAIMLALAIFMFSCAGAESRKQATLHYTLGKSHLENENYQPAFIEFQKALEYDSGNKDIHNALGYVYLKFEDLESARRSFEKAVSIDKNFSDAWNNLCLVNLLQRNYTEAVSNCGKAVANPLYETPQKSFYNMGLAYYKQGRYDEAARAFNDALRRIGGFYPALYGLALVHRANRDYGSAAEALEKAVRLDPAFRGDMEKAERELPKRRVFPIDDGETENLLEIFRY